MSKISDSAARGEPKGTGRDGRRAFIKRSLIVLGAAPVAGRLAAPGRAAAQTPTVALDESAPQAQALGYVHDATKADTAKFPKRAEPGGDQQFCSNCLLLQESGLKAEGKEGEWGKCALFVDGLVNAKGWCNSWAQKAA